MAHATLDLMALYNYDATILCDLVIPADVSRETFIHNLLLETAELEILYPRPDFLKFAIAEWSKKRLPVWEKLEATTKLEYNPIENYDRKEDWTDTENRDLRETENVDASTSGKTESISSGTNKTESAQTKTEQTSAFNDYEFHNNSKETISATEDNSTTAENSGTDSSENSSERKTINSGTVDNLRSGHAHGNIGVTTTQKMIQEERNIVNFTVIDFIIREFKQRFCLLVY